MVVDLTEIPAQSGVYAFNNWQQRIIYVGSAIGRRGLRARVKQYFTPYGKIDPIEIAGIHWLACAQAREVEKLLIQYFHATGEPIQNVYIPKAASVPCGRFFEKFNYLPVWHDNAMAEIASRRQKLRMALTNEYHTIAGP